MPCVVVGKVRVVVLAVIVDRPNPVPERATVCGEPAALSVIERVALKAAAEAGSKAT